MYSFEFDPGRVNLTLKSMGSTLLKPKLSDNTLILLKFKQSQMTNPDPWSAIITYRSEKIRITSVRRSRESEVALYESQEV